jgi:hypothetical protein
MLASLSSSMTSSLSPQFASAVAELPLALQRVVTRELDAGNTIAEVGHCFPAAPIGVYVKMHRPLALPDHCLPADVRYAERPAGSAWLREYTDEKRHSFVIDTPPPYMPPEAVQTTPAETALPVNKPVEAVMLTAGASRNPFVNFADTYSCRLDFRGETLFYEEADRSADMQCFWTKGYFIEAGTIQRWQYKDGHSVAVTDEERLEIVRRVVAYAKKIQGVVMGVNV